MTNSLSDVIEELKIVSGGKRNNTPLPDDDLIAKYEKDIGFTFSSDYKKLIQEVGNIYYGTIDLLSVTADKKFYGELSTAISDAASIGVPESWLPICEDNGSYYCLDQQGHVRYWTGDGSSEEQWPNLASWVKDVWIEGN
ncbi:SMI1/KNR4 family protein [Salmonella enterica subsp. enterica]|nr:SMI1/KNR4 family protein [Salmonella enterica]EBQ9480107.1 SMI1/KNR4 family protein [Salmonella enterica subsp. enterica serovar Kokomlemle]ECS5198543.1 SMI1/KNR4 family protein [Salmonella enterica subsp. enterica serovar Poano]EBJ7122035.1 SMI1/KNR4 family protein [Salmonella enterica]ECX4750943.1 SMI1/KNR4 family protein [Salmonella enterica]